MSTPSPEAEVTNPRLLTLLWSMAALLVSYGLLMAGTGLFNTFIGLRAEFEGFSRDYIGYLVAAYYVGLMLGSLRCGPLINRIGHIRAFAAFSSLSATATLVFPFVTEPWAWLLLRVVIGFNLAGVFTVAESWLNNRATPATRGTLLSLYMTTSYLALGSGQLLMNFGDIAGPDPFMLAAILFCVAVLPVALTRATHPPPVASPHFNARLLYRASPTALLACLCSGLSVGALWGLSPLFARDLGLSVAEIASFMSVVILSAMFFQYPIGRLSDRFDRRSVMLGVCSLAALASVLMMFQLQVYAPDSPWEVARSTTWLRHPMAITAVAALYGGVISTLYPMGVAYANDYIEAEDRVAVSPGLVLAFGAGAAAGPIPAGYLMEWLGPLGLYLHTAIVSLALATFIGYRMTRRSWAGVVEKETFVVLPVATSTPIPLMEEPEPSKTAGASRIPRWIRHRQRRGTGRGG